MINKLKNNILDIYIILNIIFIFIASYLRLIEIIEYKNFGYYLHISAITNIIVIIILIITKIKQKKFKINITDILLILMLIFAVISTIFAYNVGLAVNGVNPRYEGIYAITYYLSLAYLSSYTKNKKLIINTIICTGTVQTIYAICQAYNLFGVIKYIHHKKIWVTGFIFNPNFYATYVLLCLLYTIGLYYEEKKSINKILYIILIALFMVGLLMANTTSCAVGLIISYIYLLIYSIKKKKYKKIIYITLIILTTTLLITKLGKTNLIHDLNKTKNEVTEISKGNYEEQFGTKRIGLWKKTLKIVPKYLLHGIGLDNFGKVLDGKAIYIKPWKYDKAHNEYLQILVTEGIFCLITYLIFYTILTTKGIKTSFKNNNIYLILPIIGYLVQAFFNISVIDVAPIFWIGIGLLTERKKTFEKSSKD
jgi:putative inorganic carbon (HCO3(-)) transporter